MKMWEEYSEQSEEKLQLSNKFLMFQNTFTLITGCSQPHRKEQSEQLSSLLGFVWLPWLCCMCKKKPNNNVLQKRMEEKFCSNPTISLPWKWGKQEQVWSQSFLFFLLSMYLFFLVRAEVVMAKNSGEAEFRWFPAKQTNTSSVNRC